MPVMHIYRADNKIETKEFHKHFYIIQDYQEESLFWETWEEQRQSRRSGSTHIWIRGASGLNAEITFVTPHWRIALDGGVLEQDAYINVKVAGKRVELWFQDYYFVCCFPNQ